MPPKVTVITVVFNAKEHIERTIQSVITQTYPNIEYIIIDGGSTDGTVDVIKQYDDRIALWRSEPDNGIFDAMNKGIDLATGDWINFMNAGDYFCAPGVLERIFADGEIDADFIYGGFVNNINIGRYVYTKEMPAPPVNDELWRNYPSHQSSFIRAEVMKNNKFNISDPLEREAGDYAKLLDFYYIKKLKFRRENVIVSNYLGGGYSSAIVFENPHFSGLKLKFKRWLLTSKYIPSYKLHLHYVLLIIRTVMLMAILRFLPDSLRFALFKRLYS